MLTANARTQLRRLRVVLRIYGHELRPWPREFAESIIARLDRYGDGLIVSEKQWEKIEEILDDYDVNVLDSHDTTS